MATLHHWDYWTTQAQPPDFIDELICRLNAAGPGDDTAGDITPDWIAAKRAQHAGMIKRYFA